MQVTDDMVDAALEAYHSTDGAPFARPDACMRAALTAALAAMWRPIEDAPKDGLRVTSETFVLAHAEKKWIRFGTWYVQEGCWYYSGTNERSQWAQIRGDDPTHFMPLPQPPKVEG